MERRIFAGRPEPRHRHCRWKRLQPVDYHESTAANALVVTGCGRSRAAGGACVSFRLRARSGQQLWPTIQAGGYLRCDGSKLGNERFGASRADFHLSEVFPLQAGVTAIIALNPRRIRKGLPRLPWKPGAEIRVSGRARSPHRAARFSAWTRATFLLKQ